MDKYKKGDAQVSRKNHKLIDGKLLQVDKKYSSLKTKQKDAIAQWMFEETKAYYEEHKRFPKGKDNDEVNWKVYEKIEEREKLTLMKNTFKYITTKNKQSSHIGSEEKLYLPFMLVFTDKNSEIHCDTNE